MSKLDIQAARANGMFLSYIPQSNGEQQERGLPGRTGISTWSGRVTAFFGWQRFISSHIVPCNYRPCHSDRPLTTHGLDHSRPPPCIRALTPGQMRSTRRTTSLRA